MLTDAQAVAYELINEHPDKVTIAGQEYDAYVSPADLQDQGIGSATATRTIVILGESPDFGEVVTFDNKSWTVEAVTDYGGASEIQVVRE